MKDNKDSKAGELIKLLDDLREVVLPMKLQLDDEVNRYELGDTVTMVSLSDNDLLEKYPGLEEKSLAISSYLDENFILSGGYPDYDAMQELKKLSAGTYRIVKGESDSFGWLSGLLIIKWEGEEMREGCEFNEYHFLF